MGHTETENEALPSDQFQIDEDHNNFDELEKEKERQMQEILPFRLPSPPQVDLKEMVDNLLQKTRNNPRMPNEFFIFRKVIVKELKALAAMRTASSQNKKAKMTKVSKMASDSWKVAPRSVKTEYRKLAREVERMYVEARSKLPPVVVTQQYNNDSTQYNDQEFAIEQHQNSAKKAIKKTTKKLKKQKKNLPNLELSAPTIDNNDCNIDIITTPFEATSSNAFSLTVDENLDTIVKYIQMYPDFNFDDIIGTPTNLTNSPFSQYDYLTMHGTPTTSASYDSFADEPSSPSLSVISTNSSTLAQHQQQHSFSNFDIQQLSTDELFPTFY
ncbi:230_t:CDS:2 [Ambispora gerdemannii]|uniref:230_t:CDS:1 n=1 Tax=Ambispora gerdemannii TaxID=144530 RepID=A0A9N8WEK1_9GLOM|nr:230_t:CDS:2 [Ambispora gerdemannii]